MYTLYCLFIAILIRDMHITWLPSPPITTDIIRVFHRHSIGYIPRVYTYTVVGRRADHWGGPASHYPKRINRNSLSWIYGDAKVSRTTTSIFLYDYNKLFWRLLIVVLCRYNIRLFSFRNDNGGLNPYNARFVNTICRTWKQASSRLLNSSYPVPGSRVSSRGSNIRVSRSDGMMVADLMILFVYLLC